MRHFATLLLSVEFNGTVILHQNKAPTHAKIFKVTENQLFLTVNSMEVRAASCQRPALSREGVGRKHTREKHFAFLLSSLWNHSDGGHDSPSGYYRALDTHVEADEYVLLVKYQTSAVKDISRRKHSKNNFHHNGSILSLTRCP